MKKHELQMLQARIDQMESLSDEGKTNYNNYNDTIEAYEQWDNDCDFASSARFWADQQLDENDPTLAEHYNRYFSTACDLSELII